MSINSSESLSDNEIMSIDDVAACLKLSPRTIRNWMAMKKFPYVRIGSKRMVLKASLLAWLKSKEFSNVSN